jgi:hypothetical protein
MVASIAERYERLSYAKAGFGAGTAKVYRTIRYGSARW